MQEGDPMNTVVSNMNILARKIKMELETYTEPVDILTSFLATAVLLFLSFVGYSRLSETIIHIPTGIGFEAMVYITYYGFPLPMIGILTPIGGEQNIAATWYQIVGNSNVRILWTGLLLNLTLFFLLSFSTIYLYRKYIKR